MNKSDSEFNSCVEAIRAGRLVVHATEGVFGFASSVDFPDTLDRITALKGRDPQASPFLVVAADLRQVERLVSLEVPCIDQIRSSWPGAVTWIFPEKSKDYPWLGGADGSLAVRVTAHPQAQQLAALAGPLVSTSANRHGEAPALTVAAAHQYFGDGVDFYLDGVLTTPGQPSEIRHAVSGERLR